MATLKYSRQRESIKEFLTGRTDHPTADFVYENMKQIYPNISLGTVYRNLSLLADLGEIQKLSSFGGADRFDARTETDIIRELTEDEASFRSLTRSWFEHSDLLTLLRLLSERGHTVIITSDHGTIRIDNPVKVTGDRETSANLRYKTGRNLAYNSREVYEITRPEDIQLPSINLSSSYIFAYNTDFLVYNNDANRYIRYYRNTYQHGEISMEEMLVPYIVLKPKQ